MPEVPHDETVGLRLELHREKSRADAFEAALRKDVMRVIATTAQEELRSELVHDLRLEVMHKDEELEACYVLIEEIKASALELAKHLPDNPKAKKALADFKKSYDL